MRFFFPRGGEGVESKTRVDVVTTSALSPPLSPSSRNTLLLSFSSSSSFQAPAIKRKRARAEERHRHTSEYQNQAPTNHARRLRELFVPTFLGIGVFAVVVVVVVVEQMPRRPAPFLLLSPDAGRPPLAVGRVGVAEWHVEQVKGQCDSLSPRS